MAARRGERRRGRGFVGTVSDAGAGFNEAEGGEIVEGTGVKGLETEDIVMLLFIGVGTVLC